MTEGTIEERVIEALDGKSENFQQVVRDKEQLIKLLNDNKKEL